MVPQERGPLREPGRRGRVAQGRDDRRGLRRRQRQHEAAVEQEIEQEVQAVGRAALVADVGGQGVRVDVGLGQHDRVAAPPLHQSRNPVSRPKSCGGLGSPGRATSITNGAASMRNPIPPAVARSP